MDNKRVRGIARQLHALADAESAFVSHAQFSLSAAIARRAFTLASSLCYSQSPLRGAHDSSLLWPYNDGLDPAFISAPALEVAVASYTSAPLPTRECF